MGQTYNIAEEIPSAEEYCQLRQVCGLSPKDVAAAQVALPRSLLAITVRNDKRLIGMGRVVGDGLHVQIVDIAVHPDFQKRGISRKILERIMEYINTRAPQCAGVSLFADVDWLYQKFGFQKPQNSLGMLYKRQPR